MAVEEPPVTMVDAFEELPTGDFLGAVIVGRKVWGGSVVLVQVRGQEINFELWRNTLHHLVFGVVKGN